jgi:hydrogenase maturation protein HypF
VNLSELQTPPESHPPALAARRWSVSGRVQGVGYRPFVVRLAARHRVSGWVRNRSGEVEILGQGAPDALSAFADALLQRAPPLARPRMAVSETIAPDASLAGFRILASDSSDEREVHIPPDYFACDDCLAELRDPANRRYRYPFINCTQCGPRYTLIRGLPYDRPNTTMAGFELCAACRQEYEDPLDRRFHAEPIACPACGPSLTFVSAGRKVSGNAGALAAAVDALRDGCIVAIKGIGGYHLMCDAGDPAAVRGLRERKQRPDKPLAVMFPQDRAVLASHLAIDRRHEMLLIDPTRPIVLVPKGQRCGLAPAVAPGLSEIGAMLPYSPLHHLLLDALHRPLVATSANVSGEPVLTHADEVERRLGHVADAFLHHDRPIQRPAEDPVVRLVADRPRWVRVGRGNAPLELGSPVAFAQPVLAVGGHMKNTIALGWDRRIVVSPHIGDLDSPRSLDVFAQSVEDLQALYGVRAALIACDAHPGYASSRWALRARANVIKVWHHHAHAAALAAEHPDVSRWLVFTWDGVGLGEDGTLWGGEGLLGRPGQWRRVASMRPFRLPGGDRAAQEPWRSAAALCWETGHDCPGLPLAAGLARQAWSKGVNAPVTTAVGRLFDAAAVLTGLNFTSSFEGQGPMLLEAAAEDEQRPAPVLLPLNERDGLVECDWRRLILAMRDARYSVNARAALWHESMAAALVAQVREIEAYARFDAVGLCGGVFQNRLLTQRVMELLASDVYAVHLPAQLSCNDAALSVGQLIEAACRQ